MFELFNIDDLYFCQIEDMIPYGMENFGGCISISGTEPKYYETIVCLKNGKYYDINHMNRIINIVRCPQREFPLTSKDSHLYILNEESLVSYREKTNTDCTALQRLPFKRNRLLKL